MILTEREVNGLAERLRSTPTLTVYVDTSDEDGPGSEGWCQRVRQAIAALRHTLRLESRAERTAFERAASRLEMRLRGLHRAARHPSWIVVIADGDVHHFTALPMRVATNVHWTLGPCLTSYPVKADDARCLAGEVPAFEIRGVIDAVASTG